MPYEFFTDGDDRNGRYALQEVDGTVWPSRKVPPRHAPDAERRAPGRWSDMQTCLRILIHIKARLKTWGNRS